MSRSKNNFSENNGECLIVYLYEWVKKSIFQWIHLCMYHIPEMCRSSIISYTMEVDYFVNIKRHYV